MTTKTTKSKSIIKVLQADVCTGCGVCQHVCPTQCLSTNLDSTVGYYRTTLDTQRCIDCGACRKVCPVYTWDNIAADQYIGNHQQILSAYSSDDEHRRLSASGGTLTTILAYMLEHNYIDACICAVRTQSKPTESTMVLLTDKYEILQSRGSVYAPTSYGEIISQIQQNDFSRIAVVGLPCHIEAISNLAERKPGIKGKIKFKISLICGGTPSLKAYDYTFKSLKVDPSAVTKVSNRGDGWPGYLTIESDSGRHKRVPYGSYYSWGAVFASPIFTPPGCKSCPDVTGYLADMSIGDAWLQKYTDDQKGRNLLLLRNLELLMIVEEMAKDGVLQIDEETYKDFIKANQNVFVQKLLINRDRKKGIIRADQLYPKIKRPHILQSGLGKIAQLILYTSERFVSPKMANRMTIMYFKILRKLTTKWARPEIY